MTDHLHDRLRAADPTLGHSAPPSSTSIRELMEKTMQTTERHDTVRPNADRVDDRRRSPWLVAAAAVAVLSLGGAGVAGVLSRGEPDTSAGPTPSVVLTLPGSNVMSSCMQYSVKVLAGMPTAFSGTVLSTGKGTVLLRVDKWYRGGKGETVALRNPDRAMTSIEGVEFTEGKRYLVTASETGDVNTCGFTASWTPKMAADFAAAFGG